MQLLTVDAAEDAVALAAGRPFDQWPLCLHEELVSKLFLSSRMHALDIVDSVLVHQVKRRDGFSQSLFVLCCRISRPWPVLELPTLG